MDHIIYTPIGHGEIGCCMGKRILDSKGDK